MLLASEESFGSSGCYNLVDTLINYGRGDRHAKSEKRREEEREEREERRLLVSEANVSTVLFLAESSR